MLTIEDIRNPKRKSGFDHVSQNERGGAGRGNRVTSWRAQVYDTSRSSYKSGKAWHGPTRKIPEEAAQDYCDYMNASREPITIEDIRNEKRKSGFDHVTRKTDRRPGRTNKTYQAQSGGGQKDRGTPKWTGPRRVTADEAAQDYCDYINSQQEVAAAAQLKSAGHERPEIEPVVRDPEEEAALGVLRDKKAQRAGRQGYVYCIGEGHGATPGYGVKIGYSVNPPKRVIELQTGNWRVLRLLGQVEGTIEDERRMHQRFIKDNLVGEWFRASPELLEEFGLNASGQPRQVPSAEGEAA